MDLNDLRSLVTVSGLLLFVALVAWVYSASRRDAFREAAELALRGEDEREMQ